MEVDPWIYLYLYYSQCHAPHPFPSHLWVYILHALPLRYKVINILRRSSPGRVMCNRFSKIFWLSSFHVLMIHEWKKKSLPEPARYQSKETHSGTGMLRYRTELLNARMPECRCPAMAISVSCTGLAPPPPPPSSSSCQQKLTFVCEDGNLIPENFPAGQLLRKTDKCFGVCIVN
jgi:hypothetical protein